LDEGIILPPPNGLVARVADQRGDERLGRVVVPAQPLHHARVAVGDLFLKGDVSVLKDFV
jgi:hypothetical protein